MRRGSLSLLAVKVKKSELCSKSLTQTKKREEATPDKRSRNLSSTLHEGSNGSETRLTRFYSTTAVSCERISRKEERKTTERIQEKGLNKNRVFLQNLSVSDVFS